MEIVLHAGHWEAGKSGRLLPPHTNPGLELVYVANGEVNWDYDGSAVKVSSGHLSYSWPWQVHGAQDVKLPAVDLYWILIPLAGASMDASARLRFVDDYGIEPEWVDELLQALHEPEQPVLRVNRDFRVYFTRLVKVLLRNELHFDLEARGLFLLAMHQLCLSLATSCRVDEMPAKLERVRVFWEAELPQQLEQHWSLDDMAAACGMGRSSFAELTKKICGDTPVPMLTRKRLECARRMLRAGEASITEIALSCGFSSSQAFATVFKAYNEVTPSAYRTDRSEDCLNGTL